MNKQKQLGPHPGEAEAAWPPVVHPSHPLAARALHPAANRGLARRGALAELAALGASLGLRTSGAAGLLALSTSLAACSNKKARRVFDNLASEMHGVAVGNVSSDKTVYAFFDTECKPCSMLWNRVLPLQQQARWVWVPLDFVNAESRRRGIECLSASDPKAWLEAHMAGREPDVALGNATMRDLADGYMTANRRALDTLPERSRGVPFLVGWHGGDLVMLKSGKPMDFSDLGFHA